MLVSGTGAGVRRIVDDDPECQGMAEAIAVALVVLLDASPQQRRASAAAPGPATHEQTAEHPEQTWTWLPVATAWWHGAISQPPRWGGDVGGTFAHRSGWGLGARLVRLFPMSQHEGSGEVRVDTIGVSAGPCWRTRLGPVVGAAACAEVAVGRQRAEAIGYLHNSSATRRWMVAGVLTSADGPLLGPLRWRLAVAATARLHRQQYSVQGVGVVQEEPAAVLWLGAGLAAAF